MVSTTAVFKGHQHPIVNSFLTRHLLLWMPRKLWNVKLHSTCDDCGKHPVTSAGVYPHVRQVLDLDGYYSLVTEILSVGSARGCGSQEAVFIIITNNYAWNMRVVRSLRRLGFGTSLSQLQKKLTEQHKEQDIVAHHLTLSQTIVEARKQQLVLPRSLMSHHLLLLFLKKAKWCKLQEEYYNPSQNITFNEK